MGYRIYDTQACEWIRDNIYLNPDGDLFLIKKSIFGRTKKPVLLDSDRYVWHQDIELYDKKIIQFLLETISKQKYLKIEV